MLAALSSGHKVGMLVVAGTFICFALASSFLLPRYWPQFPGPRGRNAYIVVALALFAAMLLAVEFFAVEQEEAAGAEPAAGETAATETGAAKTITVAETEFKVALPSTDLGSGAYVFEVKNEGKVGHDLAIEGGGVEKKTPVIDPGQSAKLEADLAPGTYDLYCTVPGHREAGMDTKVKVS